MSEGTQSPGRAPCACSHPSGKGAVSPGNHNQGGVMMFWGMNLCCVTQRIPLGNRSYPETGVALGQSSWKGEEDSGDEGRAVPSSGS